MRYEYSVNDASNNRQKRRNLGGLNDNQVQIGESRYEEVIDDEAERPRKGKVAKKLKDVIIDNCKAAAASLFKGINPFRLKANIRSDQNRHNR